MNGRVASARNSSSSNLYACRLRLSLDEVMHGNHGQSMEWITSANNEGAFCYDQPWPV
jgi:hypothetical protein